MKITVKLRNTSPLFSAAPGAASISIDGKLVNPPAVGFPYVRTRFAGVLSMDEDADSRMVQVPVIPSNTMRNLLRRVILGEIIEPALIEKRNNLSLAAYATAYTGSASGNPDGLASTFEEIAVMRQHPFIGLFGGGPRMLRGRLSCGHLYPIHQNALRVIGEEYQDEAVKGGLTQPVWVVRKDPFEQLTEPEQTKVLADGEAAVNAWVQASLQANADKSKKEKDPEASSERGLKAMNAHEVVIPGVPWLWRIALEAPSEAQVGAVLQAITKLGAGAWRIAGGHSKGYGDAEVESIALNGKTVWEGGQFTEETMGYFDALAEAIDTLTSAEFEEFAASRKSK